MTTKSKFTNQFASSLARSTLVENNYFIGIAQTDPWPSEIDEISPNPDLPDPYLPEIGLQNLIGIVRVKAIQPLVPLNKVAYIKSLTYNNSISLPVTHNFNRIFTTSDSVWLYSTDQLFSPIFGNSILLDKARLLVSSLGSPFNITSDLNGYLYGLNGSPINNTLTISKFTNTARDFKTSVFPNFNDLQKIQNIGAVEGQFYITFKGSNTVPINSNITPTELKPLLEALPEIGIGNIRCVSETGSNSPLNASPIIVEFIGDLSNTNQPLFDTVNINLVGNTPTIRVTKVRTGLSNIIQDISSDYSYLTCLNKDGFLIPINNQTLQRSPVYSELDLRDLLGLTNPSEVIKLHYHVSDSYLLLISNLNNVFVLDKFTYTTLSNFTLPIPPSDAGNLLHLCVLGSKLYALTTNNVHIFDLVYELDNFTIFEYGNSKFVGVSKNKSSLNSFRPIHVGWYAEILPNQLPPTTFRQTVLLNNVRFKPNVNTAKSVFLSSEIDYYETVFISNHEPQIINTDTYKLLKVVRSF